MRSLRSLPAALLALLSATTIPLASAAEELGIDTTKLVACSRPSENGDQIAVHYKGRLESNGQEFDQSYKRGKPFVFTLGANMVIKGWDQGLLDMCPGEERTLTVPPELGYGEFGREPAIPGNSTLIFETKLMEIIGVEQQGDQTTYGAIASGSTIAPSAQGSDSAFTTATRVPGYPAPASDSSTTTSGVVQAVGPSSLNSSASAVSSTTPASATTGETTTYASTQADFGIATAPPTPHNDENVDVEDHKPDHPTTLPPRPTPATNDNNINNPPPPPIPTVSPMQAQDEEKQAECRLLGPFALLVQGALGLVALLSLVYKRWRETPKRPWRIFFFDVSKQVLGSCLTHVLNLAMSMLGSVDMVNSAAEAAVKHAKSASDMPNPCSFYLLNLAIDTTLGIPILYLLLKILTALFTFTPLARPPQSLKSGNYGSPPRTTWWLKQALIYFIALTGMKMCVWLLFALLPWLPWVGDWALRWTKGNTALQVVFAMFVFPLAMNAVQYWVIDNFIMDKSRGAGGSVGAGEGAEYERVLAEDMDEDEDDEDGEGVFRDERRYDGESGGAEDLSGKDAGEVQPSNGGMKVDGAGKKQR